MLQAAEMIVVYLQSYDEKYLVVSFLLPLFRCVLEVDCHLISQWHRSPCPGGFCRVLGNENGEVFVHFEKKQSLAKCCTHGQVAPALLVGHTAMDPKHSKFSVCFINQLTWDLEMTTIFVPGRPSII